MLAHVQLDKIDVGVHGEVYEVSITPIEGETQKVFTFKIHEYDFERFKKMFPNCKKHGKWEQEETYT